MVKGKICPRCGHTSEERAFVGSFCEHCFQQTHEPARVPQDLEIDQCVSCSRVRLRGEWVPFTGSVVAGWIQAKVKHAHPLAKTWASIVQDKHGLEADLHYTYKVHGKELPWRGRARVLVRRAQCPDDAKQSSGYYTAIVQLRGPEKRVDEAMETLVEALESNHTYIAKSISQREGVDLYVGDKSKLQQVFEQLRVTFEASRKLMGQKQGKNLYLTTYLLRL